MDTSDLEADYLAHYGVLGMHWGIRKDRSGSDAPKVSRKVNAQAEKDAQEFARAVMYYGQGAGTRRKLIGQTVEYRKRTVPGYTQAFDHHFNNQDMSRHATKAINERTWTDRRQKVRQGSGYVARRLTGELGTTAAFTAAAIAGAAYLNSPQGRRMMSSAGASLRDLGSTAQRTVNARNIRRFMQQ